MDDSQFWQSTATRLARRLNLGRWLEVALPVGAALSIVTACVLLVLRNRGAVDPALAGLGVAGVFTIAAVAVFVLDTRRHLVTSSDALVWLEHRLRLNNRLTSASAGVGRWPAPREQARGLLGWRLSRLLPAPLFSAALLLAAHWVPVTVDRGPIADPVSLPAAWGDMERWLDEAQETELVDERAIDAWHERVDALENQPKEEWYRHSSLEAGDSLREELASELRALERGLSDVEAALSEMIALDEDASADKRRLSQDRLGESLDQLELGSLPLSRKMKRQLMTLARERTVRPMTREQLEALRERLRERRYANLPRPGDEAYAFVTPGTSGASNPNGANGAPGTGGVTRGPGSAPIELAEERTELGTSRIEDVRGHEPLGIELGETVSVGLGEHDVDTSGFRRGAEAGTTASTGDGGELVWSQTLSPRERRVLEKYFK